MVGHAQLLIHAPVMLGGLEYSVKQVSCKWHCGLNLCINVSLYPLVPEITVEVDCGDPGTPQNGRRVLLSTTFGSQVTYSCIVGYDLQGVGTRVCLGSGLWSGSLPTCECEFSYNLYHQ